jgi:hypothetical protein
VRRTLLESAIHRATVTRAGRHDVGSVTSGLPGQVRGDTVAPR